MTKLLRIDTERKIFQLLDRVTENSTIFCWRILKENKIITELKLIYVKKNKQKIYFKISNLHDFKKYFLYKESLNLYFFREGIFAYVKIIACKGNQLITSVPSICASVEKRLALRHFPKELYGSFLLSELQINIDKLEHLPKRRILDISTGGMAIATNAQEAALIFVKGRSIFWHLFLNSHHLHGKAIVHNTTLIAPDSILTYNTHRISLKFTENTKKITHKIENYIMTNQIFSND